MSNEADQLREQALVALLAADMERLIRRRAANRTMVLLATARLLGQLVGSTSPASPAYTLAVLLPVAERAARERVMEDRLRTAGIHGVAEAGHA